MKPYFIAALIIISGPIAEGCSNTYTIKTSDNFPGEIFVVHTAGTSLQVGMRLSVFQTHNLKPTLASGHQHGKYGRWEPVQRLHREKIGLVEIIEIIDDGHAKVRIVSGKAGNDLEAEPAENER
ncbi:MAG: hypothetical protein HUU02_04490 [Bacteroidetes bacterium]|jgi:hypothetical protein|nr:hypothetical protein [Bacteroidota bacterium]